MEHENAGGYVKKNEKNNKNGVFLTLVCEILYVSVSEFAPCDVSKMLKKPADWNRTSYHYIYLKIHFSLAFFTAPYFI